ncbi:MAG: DNA replication/repair protein RecF [Lachnospiraceae bacterium]|nr:DNA replication/repair protein RecF [Lachnospiraceae bacterium]
MHVKRLLLRDYRNYEELSLDMKEGINIFYGDNAQGKTNLLEAVFFCATGRSHRTTNEKECIRHGKDETLISLVYEIRGKEEKIDISLKKRGRKIIRVNDYPIHKISELIGRFHVVVFSPEDLSIIKSSPLLRRKFIDMELSQMDAVYLHDLQQYYHVLKQRNELLKDTGDRKALTDTIFAWDRQLVYYGIRIMKRREAFVKKLEEYTARIHSEITAGSKQKEIMTIRYAPQAPMEEETFLEALERHLDRDMRLGNTGDGPQHDDMIISLNGVEVRTYGSQGQQRTSALSLKLAELQMMKDETGEAPVLLLDDVMSELDRQRQMQLSAYIKDHQTILTCTGVEDSIRSLPDCDLYHVSEGRIL